MTAREIREKIARLEKKRLRDLHRRDFLLTWDKGREELEAIIAIAEVLRALREENISTRMWDSGLAISQFRDNSTRTRFSFASASNLLGLTAVDLDEGKSQIAHGETVRETSVMVSYMAEAIGIRDDLYIGKGHTYMKAVADAVEKGFLEGVLEQRPSVINLQCDIDHPTQSMADLAHLVSHFGGIEALKGKKVAMSWAYSPSYGKPLSVPQGIIGLLPRFGMEVTLAHPEGYSLMPEVLAKAKGLAAEAEGGFRVCGSMEEAFEGADVVYPKSWAPFAVMEERTRLVETGDRRTLEDLEKHALEHNARFKNWQCTETLMSRTHQALYLHCLPADISGVSCAEGEVAADVFERFRLPLYKQAGHKPYIIAAMILAARAENPAAALSGMLARAQNRAQ